MELTRRDFFEAGWGIFGGAAIFGLAGCPAPGPGQEEENSPTASTLTSKGSR